MKATQNNIVTGFTNVRFACTFIGMSSLEIKSVRATILRNNLSEVLNAVTGDSVMLVKRRGKADAAILSVDLLEDLLVLQSKDYVKSIAQARKEIEEGDLIPATEIFGES